MITAIVRGRFVDGTVFEGTDTLRIISKKPLGIKGVQFFFSLLANLREALSQLLGLLKSR